MAHKGIYSIHSWELQTTRKKRKKIQKSYIQVNSRVRESESKACLWLWSSTRLEVESLEYQGGEYKIFLHFLPKWVNLEANGMGLDEYTVKSLNYIYSTQILMKILSGFVPQWIPYTQCLPLFPDIPD